MSVSGLACRTVLRMSCAMLAGWGAGARPVSARRGMGFEEQLLGGGAAHAVGVSHARHSFQASGEQEEVRKRFATASRFPFTHSHPTRSHTFPLPLSLMLLNPALCWQSSKQRGQALRSSLPNDTLALRFRPLSTKMYK